MICHQSLWKLWLFAEFLIYLNVLLMSTFLCTTQVTSHNNMQIFYYVILAWWPICNTSKCSFIKRISTAVISCQPGIPLWPIQKCSHVKKQKSFPIYLCIYFYFFSSFVIFKTYKHCLDKSNSILPPPGSPWFWSICLLVSFLRGTHYQKKKKKTKQKCKAKKNICIYYDKHYDLFSSKQLPQTQFVSKLILF